MGDLIPHLRHVGPGKGLVFRLYLPGDVLGCLSDILYLESNGTPSVVRLKSLSL
jgi:hypothetical protein